ANLPLADLFWPQNVYMYHRELGEIRKHTPALCPWALEGPALTFYESVGTVLSPAELARAAKDDPSLLSADRLLFLQAGPPSAGQSLAGAAPGAAGSSGFAYRCLEWGYNAFRFEVTAPRDGWVYVHQLSDPLWRVTVDGRRVDPVRAHF